MPVHASRSLAAVIGSVRLALLLGSAALLSGASTASAADKTAELVAAGKKLFVQCAACHSVSEEGMHGIGPNLRGILGMPAAAQEDFQYSPALRSANIVWTDQALDKWLENPKAMVPANSMVFVGMPKPADRKALIAYLKSVAAP
jgi:cytochrome c